MERTEINMLRWILAEMWYLVLVLEGQVLVDMWQVLYFYFLIFTQYAL